ncbi:MAG: helix-turn-helix transcriptional regulator [Coriobacteriia bacterium]|nr:helix-turn-helix transcriptional regulator [Coriobacteriia bacterium]
MSQSRDGRGLHCPESKSNLALTGREAQVLRRLLDGQTNKQIAHELGITAKTVEFHVSKLLKKHGVSSRFGLMDGLRPSRRNPTEKPCAAAAGLVTCREAARDQASNTPPSNTRFWESSRLGIIARIAFSPGTGFPHIASQPDLATPGVLLVGSAAFMGLVMILELSLVSTSVSTMLSLASAAVIVCMIWFTVAWPMGTDARSVPRSTKIAAVLSVTGYALLPTAAWTVLRGLGVLIAGEAAPNPGALVHAPDSWPFWSQALLSTLNTFSLWSMVLMFFAVGALSGGNEGVSDYSKS